MLGALQIWHGGELVHKAQRQSGSMTLWISDHVIDPVGAAIPVLADDQRASATSAEQGTQLRLSKRAVESCNSDAFSTPEATIRISLFRRPVPIGSVEPATLTDTVRDSRRDAERHGRHARESVDMIQHYRLAEVVQTGQRLDKPALDQWSGIRSIGRGANPEVVERQVGQFGNDVSALLSTLEHSTWCDEVVVDTDMTSSFTIKGVTERGARTGIDLEPISETLITEVMSRSEHRIDTLFDGVARNRSHGIRAGWIKVSGAEKLVRAKCPRSVPCVAGNLGWRRELCDLGVEHDLGSAGLKRIDQYALVTKLRGIHDDTLEWQFAGCT